MAARTDIIETSRLGPTTELPSYRYPFIVVVQCRLLTEDHGPGRPELRPVQIRSILDVAMLRPRQEIRLKDETGAERTYVIDYATGVVSGQDLIDNTTPDRIVELMHPAEPQVPHELGLCDRLGHYIAASHCLRQRLSEGAELNEKLDPQCDAAEAYLVSLLDEIDQLTEPAV